MYKATQTSDGNWHCDKCQQTYPNCVRRFIISACVADDTATTWVSLYNEQAETLFDGVTADQLYQNFIETNDKDLYNSTFLKSTYTEWVMTCKVKQELVGDETRTKTSIVRMSPVDYVKESRNILTALAAF
jgi:replication factor A1